jgi:hypothetical protein
MRRSGCASSGSRLRMGTKAEQLKLAARREIRCGCNLGISPKSDFAINGLIKLLILNDFSDIKGMKSESRR